MKIMIVDDEENIREGLKKIILKLDNKYKVAATASNGEDAISLLKEKCVDLVITDIRMPKIDGVEFVKQIQFNYPDIKKIILSGFDDFNYVRETMKNGAMEYLIKPVDKKQLSEVLEKIEQEIKIEKEQKQKHQKLLSKLDESMPLIKENLSDQLLSGNNEDDSILRKKLEECGISLYHKYYHVIVASIDNSSYLYQNKDFDYGANLLQFRNSIQESITGYTRFFMCRYKKELIIILSFDGEKEMNYFKALKKIEQNLFKNTSSRFSIAVGKRAFSLREISRSYATAMEALQHRYYRTSSSVIKYTDIKKAFTSDYSKCTFFTNFESRIKNCIDLLNPHMISSILNDFRKKIEDNFIDRHLVNNMLFDIYTKLRINHKAFDQSVKALYGEDYSYQKTIEMFDTFDEIQKYLYEFFNKIINYLASQNGRNDFNIVEIAKEYIKNNYYENITLEKVSKITFTNPSYLCEVFSQTTGQTLIDFLTKIRIERAKTLLKDDTMNTYEIGKMVGYREPSYFSKVFKKTAGLSPTAYRKLLKS